MTSTDSRGAWTTSIRDPDDVVRRLEQRGYRVGLVSGATSLKEALAAIGAALDFPSYYGKNLDALWDCLSDLTTPTALVWVGWQPLAVYAAADWSTVADVLRQRVDAAGAPFSVVFCSPDASA